MVTTIKGYLWNAYLKVYSIFPHQSTQKTSLPLELFEKTILTSNQICKLKILTDGSGRSDRPDLQDYRFVTRWRGVGGSFPNHYHIYEVTMIPKKAAHLITKFSDSEDALRALRAEFLIQTE